MSNPTLTPAIAAAYYGASYETIDGIVTLESVQRIGFHGSSPERASRFYGYDEAKMLLTPLPKITFGDAKEIYKIIFSPLSTSDLIMYKRGEAILVYSKHNDDGALADGCLITYPEKLEIIYREDGKLESPDTYRALLIWDYLRSKGYDCGFGQDIPSLIDAGLAIDSTKHKTWKGKAT